MRTYIFISVLNFRGLKCRESNESHKLSTGGENKPYGMYWDEI